MQVEFCNSFVKDIKRISDKAILQKIQKVIIGIEEVAIFSEIPNIKHIADSRKYYRIRVGNYRLGIKLENGVVKFIRCLNRKDMYRNFP